MGGHPPLGYDLKERKLYVNAAEANLIRWIFTSYADCRCIRTLRDQLHAEGAASKQRISQAGIAYGGMPFSTGALSPTAACLSPPAPFTRSSAIAPTSA
jgi:hypothetical protein